MGYTGPFPLGCHNTDIVCFGKDFPEGQKALGVNTIVIGDKN
jgi:hypothetical protein